MHSKLNAWLGTASFIPWLINFWQHVYKCLSLLPNSPLICKLEDVREWFPISWHYSEIAKMSPYHWCKCSHSNNNKIHFIGTFYHLHNSVSHSPAEFPLKSVCGFQEASHRRLPLIFLWSPLLMETVHKAITQCYCTTLSMFWVVLLLILPVVKSHIALSQLAEKGSVYRLRWLVPIPKVKLGCRYKTGAKRTMFGTQVIPWGGLSIPLTNATSP